MAQPRNLIQDALQDQAEVTILQVEINTKIVVSGQYSMLRLAANIHEASIGDENVRTALLEYHRRNITNKYTISKLLQAEHGIKLS
jgi:hypothetical protein